MFPAWDLRKPWFFNKKKLMGCLLLFSAIGEVCLNLSVSIIETFEANWSEASKNTTK
jgi:hypothetical protein